MVNDKKECSDVSTRGLAGLKNLHTNKDIDLRIQLKTKQYRIPKILKNAKHHRLRFPC